MKLHSTDTLILDSSTRFYSGGFGQGTSYSRKYVSFAFDSVLTCVKFQGTLV